MNTLQEKLGARIKELRKSRNITQEKLAETIGLNVPNMSNLERGKKFVSSKTLEKIIKALDVSERDLFDFRKFQTRGELLSLINNILQNSSTRDICYFYRMMSLYKES